MLPPVHHSPPQAEMFGTKPGTKRWNQSRIICSGMGYCKLFGSSETALKPIVTYPVTVTLIDSHQTKSRLLRISNTVTSRRFPPSPHRCPRARPLSCTDNISNTWRLHFRCGECYLFKIVNAHVRSGHRRHFCDCLCSFQDTVFISVTAHVRIRIFKISIVTKKYFFRLTRNRYGTINEKL